MGTPSSDAGEQQRIEAFCEVAARLGSPVRLELMALLAKGPRSVGELRQMLGLEQALVSHHLGKLREVGLAISERRGRCVFYEHAACVKVVEEPDGPAIVVSTAMGQFRFGIGGLLGRATATVEFKPEGRRIRSRHPPRTA
jgi:DNA-binding transcriptional ArsR family regulator